MADRGQNPKEPWPLIMAVLLLLGWALPGQIDRVLMEESQSLMDTVGRSTAKTIGHRIDRLYRALCEKEPRLAPENGLGRLFRQLLLRGAIIALIAPLWIPFNLGLWLDATVAAKSFTRPSRLAHPERYPSAHRLFQGSLVLGWTLLLGPLPMGPGRLLVLLTLIGIGAWHRTNTNEFR